MRSISDVAKQGNYLAEPVVVPAPFFSSIRQKYVVPAAIVPGLYVVPA
jgi:hypothetical protein